MKKEAHGLARQSHGCPLSNLMISESIVVTKHEIIQFYHIEAKLELLYIQLHALLGTSYHMWSVNT